MPLRVTPILNFRQVDDRIASGNDYDQYFHAFGILRKEIDHPKQWILFDEERREVKIKLDGPLSDYPRPKPGDVVRIHRLSINRTYKVAESKLGRNVVYWDSCKKDPKPTSTAQKPTITPDDTERVRILQAYLYTRFERIQPLKLSKVEDIYLDFVAGRVESQARDTFGHSEILFNDGDNVATLRVFAPNNSQSKRTDVDDHFKLATQLGEGQYFIASNIKYDRLQRFNLSASLGHGRSIRLIERSSILGVKLAESITKPESKFAPSSATESSQGQLRRSPRFLNQESSQGSPTTTQDLPQQPLVSVAQAPAKSDCPKYTKFCDIQKSDRYAFYNLAGRVHGKVLLDQYGHAIIPVFDGSKHDFTNFSGIDHLEGCLYVIVYCKVKDSDVADHFNKATLLKEGDLIHLINVKVTMIDRKIKLELQANNYHNKSLNIIDKASPFGQKISSELGMFHPRESETEQETPDQPNAESDIEPGNDPDIDPDDVHYEYMTGEGA